MTTMEVRIKDRIYTEGLRINWSESETLRRDQKISLDK